MTLSGLSLDRLDTITDWRSIEKWHQRDLRKAASRLGKFRPMGPLDQRRRLEVRTVAPENLAEELLELAIGSPL